jgi:hypothetical protein
MHGLSQDTAVPPHWYGSTPEPMVARARQLKLDDDLGDWEIRLILAQKRFGLSLDQDDLSRP